MGSTLWHGDAGLLLTGVFVVLCGIVYALHRFKKVDFLSRFGNRELRRGKYGIYGWRSKGQTLPSDAVDAFSRDDDEALNEKGWLGPSFGSIRKPDAAVMSVKDKTSWQDPRWPNPLQSSPPSYSGIFPGAHQTYRQSDIVSPLSELATSNSSMNMLVGNSPPLSLQYDHEKETMEPTYQSFATQATQNRYDQSGDTQENNRASNLSSLSSGFGDRLTLSDGSSGRARQSSAALGSVRDTLSTTVSGVSSRAGYRTINSWVGYQAGQLLGAQGESAVPAVPRVPSMLQPQQQQQLDGQSSSASSIVSRATSTTDPVAKMAYSDEKEVASLR